MAVCPKCQWNVNVTHIIAQDMICPHCSVRLGFNRREYRRAARPGLYVALAIIFNLFLTDMPVKRVVISFLLLLAWFIFFREYRKYLRTATLELRD